MQIFIVQDQYDCEQYNVYNIANNLPWTKLFTIHVDDIKPVFGWRVFDELDFEENNLVRFEVLKCEVIE